MKKKRKIYAYSGTIMKYSETGETAEIIWDSSLLEEVFKYIKGLPEKKKVMEKKEEWFFYLADYQNKTDNVGNSYIRGYFEWVRIGYLADLKRLSTLKTRPNPKNPDESEIHKTFFYIRLKDGVLLLENYKDNVITAKRMQDYFKEKAKPVYEKSRIHYINFLNRVSKGFLEKLTHFGVIRLAKLRLSMESNEQYDTSDAIGVLQETTRPAEPNYIDIIIGKKNARKNGLLPGPLKDILNKLMTNRERIKAGIIEGASTSGDPLSLSLNGIEERYIGTFNTNDKGEILETEMYDFLMKTGTKI